MPQTNKNIVPVNISPGDALGLLKAGNFRFINNLQINHPLLYQVNKTKEGQWPFAAILSCMDSRTSAELIFDLGMGDIFSIRLAGNVISDNVLGSLEYATAVAGSKLILVLGHTDCGAIKGACNNVQLGNLTTLLDKIQPAIAMEQTITNDRTGSNKEFVNAVAQQNVLNSVAEIMHRSSIIREQVAQGKVSIVPAMYHVSTGKVVFYEQGNEYTTGNTQLNTIPVYG